MLRNFVLALAPFALSAAVQAAPKCYQLSVDGEVFSRTPEVLCVDDGAGHSAATITLETGIVRRTIATFQLDLLERARCIDCNADRFGLLNPSNSILNELSIKFNGQRSLGADDASETGTLTIGANAFHYRSL
jgi:hypothetical protein